MATNAYKTILTNTAKEEIEKIYEYIANTLIEKEVANKLMTKIEQSILSLEENPYLCIEVRVKPHNELYRKLVIDNYIVLYDIEEKNKQVVIYRAIYGKRDYLIIEN